MGTWGKKKLIPFDKLKFNASIVYKKLTLQEKAKIVNGKY